MGSCTKVASRRSGPSVLGHSVVRVIERKSECRGCPARIGTFLDGLMGIADLLNEITNVRQSDFTCLNWITPHIRGKLLITPLRITAIFAQKSRSRSVILRKISHYELLDNLNRWNLIAEHFHLYYLSQQYPSTRLTMCRFVPDNPCIPISILWHVLRCGPNTLPTKLSNVFGPLLRLECFKSKSYYNDTSIFILLIKYTNVRDAYQCV